MLFHSMLCSATKSRLGSGTGAAERRVKRKETGLHSALELCEYLIVLERLSNRSRAFIADAVPVKAVQCNQEQIRIKDRGGGEKIVKEKETGLGTHLSVVSVLLCLSGSPIAAAPSSPMLLSPRLCGGVRNIL
jgi:hypothetical protein